ncbi:unnamed protein product, partial [Heterosigma akashiwo]
KVKLQEFRKCPYLDTINRNYLDFDFEKLCSVSLTNFNVYACLVCGKFFQGRGQNTHAYTHSVQASHHVWINLNTNKIYCLPDNYEVVDSSLADVGRALAPQFSEEQLAALDGSSTLARDVFGVAYLPGYIGLNNLRCTDFVSVTLHALAHVAPLRDFFLRPENYAHSTSPLVHRFGEVMRKIWSPHNFKSSVSPHEFVQAITVASRKRFRIGDQAEAVDFLAWLLNSLHQGLGGTRKKNSSIVHHCFQGTVYVTTHTKKRKQIKLDSDDESSEDEDGAQESKGEEKGEGSGEWEVSEGESPFLHLTLKIPDTPLFKDSQGGNIIPQVPLFTALEKFDGRSWTDQVKFGVHTRRQYRLQSLPRYLIFHLTRFTKNNFFLEKNPTIVNFPVKNLELKDYFLPAQDEMPTEEELAGMPYNLLANVCHDSPPGAGGDGKLDPLKAGTYRVHVHNKASGQWYEIQDLHVTETEPERIGVSESYLLIYERKETAA